MRFIIFLVLIVLFFPLFGQEEADTVVTEPLIEDSLTSDQEIVLPETELEDTTAVELLLETELDTSSKIEVMDVPQTLDAGYKGFAWGMNKEQLSFYVEFDSLKSIKQGNVIKIPGFLGDDSVTFNYHFSDKGFWKVSIDYLIQSKELKEFIGHFSRIEKLLTKRYGSPKRTTQNEMGIVREYLFSDFPKLSRAYFRSSWKFDDVRIELILDGVLSKPDEALPVFDDMKPILRLYYYHPVFFLKVEPVNTEIPEDSIINVY